MAATLRTAGRTMTVSHTGPQRCVPAAALLSLAVGLASAAGAVAQMSCSGGNAIGISIDSSGSVIQEFGTVSQQVRVRDHHTE